MGCPSGSHRNTLLLEKLLLRGEEGSAIQFDHAFDQEVGLLQLRHPASPPEEPHLTVQIAMQIQSRRGRNKAQRLPLGIDDGIWGGRTAGLPGNHLLEPTLGIVSYLFPWT